MPKQKSYTPILNTLLLGGWATVYCIAVTLALHEIFPVLTLFLPLKEVSLIFGIIAIARIYVVQVSHK